MKAFKTIVIIAVSFLSHNIGYSQTSMDIRNLLKSKIWVLNDGLKATKKYTDTEVIYYLKDEFFYSEKYHLSDKNCIDGYFDTNKVGLLSVGSYIMYEKSNCSYIEFITPTEIKMGTYNGSADSIWTIIYARP